MPVITITRASYSHGRMIAEKVARELNYQCISQEIISLASQQYDIPENWLRQAIEDAPSLFDHFSYGKKKYLAYIRSALLEYAAKDDIVYHGLAGHLLLEGVPNVLRVIISANIEERVKIEVEREKVSENEAKKNIKKFDKERKKWANYFYDKDPWNTSMYDLTLVIGGMSVDDAVKRILETVKLPAFQTTDESKLILKQNSLAAKIKSDLMNFYSDIEVSVDDSTIVVHIQRDLRQEEAVVDDINAIIAEMEIPEGQDIRVNVVPV